MLAFCTEPSGSVQVSGVNATALKGGPESSGVKAGALSVCAMVAVVKAAAAPADTTTADPVTFVQYDVPGPALLEVASNAAARDVPAASSAVGDAGPEELPSSIVNAWSCPTTG